MQKNSIDIESNEHDVTLHNSETFIPIDVDWRKTYYKRILIKRVFAFLLDLITTVPLAFIIAYIIAARIAFVLFFLYFLLKELIIPDTADTADTADTINIMRAVLIVYTIVIYLFMFLPFGIMESSKSKGTFGKRIMKIEITDSYGNRISFWRSLGRNILKLLTLHSYILIIPIFRQCFTYRKTKKLFHDKGSSTIIGERL
jgi:uncharacterized RDD family membrane protein YckC